MKFFLFFFSNIIWLKSALFEIIIKGYFYNNNPLLIYSGFTWRKLLRLNADLNETPKGEKSKFNYTNNCNTVDTFLINNLNIPEIRSHFKYNIGSLNYAWNVILIRLFCNVIITIYFFVFVFFKTFFLSYFNIIKYWFSLNHLTSNVVVNYF